MEEKKENKEEIISQELQKSKTLSPVKCPYCYEDIPPDEENNIIKPESKISCNKCKKNFFYIKCFHCSGKIYYKQEISLINLIIKCPYSKCQKKLFNINLKN